MKAKYVSQAVMLPVLTLLALAASSQPPDFGPGGPGGRGGGRGGFGGGGDPSFIEQRMREAGVDPAAINQLRQQIESGGDPREVIRGLVTGAAGAAGTEGLTLFVDDGGSRGGGSGNQQQNNQQVTPSVVLKGIYRLGDTYHVSVQSSDGVTQTAQWQSGSSAPVLNGYQIQAVDARNVTMSVPSGAECRTATGTSCLGRNQMAVTLVPTQPRRNLAGNNNQNNNQQQNNNNQQWWAQGNNVNATQIRQLLETVIGGRQQQTQQQGRGNFNNNNNNNGGRGGGGRGGNNQGGRGGGGGNQNNNAGNAGGGRGGGGFN